MPSRCATFSRAFAALPDNSAEKKYDGDCQMVLPAADVVPLANTAHNALMMVIDTIKAHIMMLRNGMFVATEYVIVRTAACIRRVVDATRSGHSATLPPGSTAIPATCEMLEPTLSALPSHFAATSHVAADVRVASMTSIPATPVAEGASVAYR